MVDQAQVKAQLAFLEELMAKAEDLDPALVPWLAEGPFGQSLKHPLVFEVVYHPQANARLNYAFQQKRRLLAEAKAAGRWHEAVFLYERPYRVDGFADICWHLDGPAYWELLGQVWSDTENAWQSYEQWGELFTADPEGRLMMSTPDERSAFTLPHEQGGFLPRTRIYRGFGYDGGLDGFSWTLDKGRARWFATRLRIDGDPTPKIASGWVARENIIAYLNGRDEQELVVLPEHVEDIEIEEVKP